MGLQNSGTPIKFSQIQQEFGGINPIRISEYYSDSPTNYVATIISGIPKNGNPIRISAFYGKKGLPAITVNGAYVQFKLESTNTYYYYNFRSTSAVNKIIFNKSTVCDILLVGGGGGGGRNGGGGGGGGFVTEHQNYTFDTGSYNIVVGNGGFAYPQTTNDGQNGGISYIATTYYEFFLEAIGGYGGLSSGRAGGKSGKETNYSYVEYIGGNGYAVTASSTYLGGAGSSANIRGNNATSSAPGVNNTAYAPIVSIISVVDVVSIGGYGGNINSSTTLNQSTIIGAGGHGGNNSAVNPKKGNDGCVLIRIAI